MRLVLEARSSRSSAWAISRRAIIRSSFRWKRSATAFVRLKSAVASHALSEINWVSWAKRYCFGRLEGNGIANAKGLVLPKVFQCVEKSRKDWLPEISCKFGFKNRQKFTRIRAFTNGTKLRCRDRASLDQLGFPKVVTELCAERRTCQSHVERVFKP